MPGWDVARRIGLVNDDPFPREAFGALIRRVPAYGRLAWRLGRDPLLSRARRAAVVAAAGYLASPIDLVPGLIPVLGQLDDIALVLAALRLALDGLDPARRQAHLAAVGLSDTDLGTDLRTVGATGAWIGRAGVRTGRRVLGSGVRAAVRGSRAVGRMVGGSRLAAGHRRGNSAGLEVEPRAHRS
jgi:uncharacterized membrane protein YkvA (DUF1232 family)